MNEKETEALVKIEFFSRNHGYKLGLAEEKIGVPHSILTGLETQKLIFSRSKLGKIYWSLTRTGKSVAGLASRNQLVENTIPASNCRTCMDLGIAPTIEDIEKAKKMKDSVGILACSDVEIHLLTKHMEASGN